MILQNFVELLIEHAATKPESTVIHSLADNWENPPKLSYSELDRRARAVAVGLMPICEPGDRVILLLPSGLDLVTAFFGCLYAGLIAVPAFLPGAIEDRSGERLKGIIADAKPRLLLVGSMRDEALLGESARSPDLRVCRMDALDLNAADGWQMPAIDSDKIAFLQYTSGSTSMPKGVMITHGNLIANEGIIQNAFEITANDTVVNWLPLFHDMGLIGGLLQPIFSGAISVLMSPRQFLERPVRWLESISRFNGTVSGGPDFAYRLCAERISEASIKGLDLRSWQLAFCGSEPIRYESYRAFVERFNKAGFHEKAFYPCYGLAEATLLVTGGKKGAGPHIATLQGSTAMGCGCTQAEHEIRIVDPELGTDTQGVGEICVRGPSVSPGYWNKPELTSEAFYLFPQGPFLRTGDLGILDDGNLFVSGRVKDLIILRGQNVYPQDIEQIIEREIDAVRKGRVAAFPVQDNGREAIGVAAEVTRTMQKIVVADALIEAIRESIGATYFDAPTVVLLLQPGALPRTSSGKLRRSACWKLWKEGQIDIFAAYEKEGTATPAITEARRTACDLEREIGTIWRAALGHDQIDSKDNFFLIGGDSIAATQIISRIRKCFNRSVEFGLFFDSPILRDFASAVAGITPENVNVEEFPRLPRFGEGLDDYYVLSGMQEGLWFLWRLEGWSSAYNIFGGLRFLGCLSIESLERAFIELIGRHSALRTRFVTLPDGSVRQRVEPAGPASIERVDLSSLPAQEREAAVRRLAGAEAQGPFDLERGPLLRVKLLRCAEDEHILLATMHHIVSDGWSMRILIEEFAALYEAHVKGVAPVLCDLPIDYADYAIWQRALLEAGEGERQLAYWRGKLAAAPAALDLPLDRPRLRTARSHQGAIHFFSVDAELTARVRALAQEREATLFMTLLAVFGVLLFRHAGAQDFCVGVPAANRGRVETEGLIGLFVNTQALRLRVDPRASFLDLLRQARETAFEAQAHQDLPFDRIVEALQPQRRLDQNPFFQVVFNHQRGGQEKALFDLPGLNVELLPQESVSSKFDLVLDVVEGESDLSCSFTYAAELFDAATIERLSGHWRNLLESIVADASVPIGELPLLDAQERKLLVEDWSRGEERPLSGLCLHEMIRARAEERPEAIAVVYEDERLSYGGLMRRAEALAHRLRARGVGPDVLVGLCVERSMEMIVGLLGILEAGGAYVPLDPSYPDERLGFMIADAGLGLVLVQAPLSDRLARIVAECGEENGLSRPGPRLLRLDQDLDADGVETGDAYEKAAQAPRVRPQNLAYCIYTSGSTGRPKGVLISHANALRLFEATRSVFAFGADDVWTMFHSYAFDFSVWEIFGALLHGGRLVVVPYETSRSTEDFLDLLGREAATVLSQTPSAFRPLAHLVAERQASLPHLRHVVFGGEALELDALRPWFERFGDRQPTLVNMYGITETTVHVTERPLATADLSAGAASPIGRAIADLSIYILTSDLQPAPIGVTGELYIGGAGLARGYLGRPGLTAERFVPNPFALREGERLYRTGDLARWRADGAIDYLGRIDHQLKIRGFRIEPGEIEACARAHADVRDAAIVAREGPAGKQLVAYVATPRASDDTDRASFVEALNAHLRAALPDHMIPARIVPLDALPLTPNGKLDRAALPDPEAGVEADYVAPRDDTERALADVFAEALGLDRVGVADNFFELGGDSMTAMKLVAQLRQSGLANVTIGDLFNHQSVEQLVAFIEKKSALTHKNVVFLKANGDGPPLYCMHPLPGQIDGYAGVASYLDGLYPVIAFQALWLTEPHYLERSIQSVAEPFSDYINSHLDERGCFILGWSWGGVLAYEVAKQIHSPERIHFIGMVDVCNIYADFRNFIESTYRHVQNADYAALEGFIDSSLLKPFWRDLMNELDLYEKKALALYVTHSFQETGSRDAIFHSTEFLLYRLFSRLCMTRKYAFNRIEVPIKSWEVPMEAKPMAAPIDWKLYAQAELVDVIGDANHISIINSAKFHGSLRAQLDATLAKRTKNDRLKDCATDLRARTDRDESP